MNVLVVFRELMREFLPFGRFRQQFGPVMQSLRRFTRFCPHCGLGSQIPEREWRRIESTDEEVPCPGCQRVPRLWMRSPVG